MRRGKCKPFFFSIARRHGAVILVHRHPLRTGSQPTLRTGSQPTKFQPAEVHCFSSTPLCSLVFSTQVQTLSRLLCEWGRCTIDTAVYVVQTVLLHNRHCSAWCATDGGCTTGTAVPAVFLFHNQLVAHSQHNLTCGSQPTRC